MNAPYYNGGPDDTPEREPAPAVRYRCLDCAWSGRSAEAYDHHAEAHHRIVIAAIGLVISFSCCADRQHRRTA